MRITVRDFDKFNQWLIDNEPDAAKGIVEIGNFSPRTYELKTFAQLRSMLLAERRYRTEKYEAAKKADPYNELVPLPERVISYEPTQDDVEELFKDALSYKRAVFFNNELTNKQTAEIEAILKKTPAEPHKSTLPVCSCQLNETKIAEALKAVLKERDEAQNRKEDELHTLMLKAVEATRRLNDNVDECVARSKDEAREEEAWKVDPNLDRRTAAYQTILENMTRDELLAETQRILCEVNKLCLQAENGYSVIGGLWDNVVQMLAVWDMRKMPAGCEHNKPAASEDNATPDYGISLAEAEQRFKDGWTFLTPQNEWMQLSDREHDTLGRIAKAQEEAPESG